MLSYIGGRETFRLFLLAPSLRELSKPQVLTEGLFYGSIYVGAYTTKVSINFVIGDSNDSQTIVFEKCCALPILFHVPQIIVLGAVQLDDKAGFMAVEIYDEAADRLLTLKTDGMMRQKIVP